MNLADLKQILWKIGFIVEIIRKNTYAQKGIWLLQWLNKLLAY